LTIIDELVKLSEKGQLEDRIYALYISPLKALSNDIERNLNTPLKEIKELAKTKYGKKLNIRVAVRTGDTTASQKSSMLKKTSTYSYYNSRNASDYLKHKKVQ
jgi:ATP-dependent Lhr-like helicase